MAPPADIFDEFRHALERYTRIAVCKRPYVRCAKFFKEWLNEENVQNLSIALWPNEVQTILPHVVVRAYRKIFSILLLIGRGEEFIKIIKDNKTVDRFLPFNPKDFRNVLKQERVSDSERLADDFCAAQWQFCAPAFEFHSQQRRSIHDVIPINRLTLINTKSRYAKLWEIEVLEDFVSIDLQRKVGSSRRISEDDGEVYYSFAVKTFINQHVEIYEAEKKAFEALRGHDGMITYLGGFEQRLKLSDTPPDQRKHILAQCREKDLDVVTTHNILLEYAEMDLDLFFRRQLPPFLEDEVRQFWQELVNLVGAVERIHNWKPSRHGKNYRGFHADIKPDNILLVSGNVKLADPGFLEFVEETESPRVVPKGITRSYGPPEYRDGERLTQAIDMWALGCVFSIAATWVVNGLSGVQNFSQIRMRASKPFFGHKCDAFHDGRELLDDVKEWHKIIRAGVRATDTITPQIVDLIEEAALRGSPSERYSAKDLLRKLRDILETPKTSHCAIPTHIMQAMYDLDSTAEVRPDGAASSDAKSIAQSHMSDREREKDKIMDLPPKKTAQRSEFLHLELKKDRDPTHPAASTRSTNAGVHRHLLSHSRQISNARSLASPDAQFLTPQIPNSHSPAHSRTSTPCEPQDIFQARRELRELEPGLLKNLMRRDGKKDQVLKNYQFANRDIVFLIDGAESMKPHWCHVQYLLDTLVRKCRFLDKDGLDCLFTNSSFELRNEKSSPSRDGYSKFYHAMDRPEVQPSNGFKTNMGAVLGGIFQKYLNELNKSYPPRKKCLTLIVLTDGLWEGMGGTREKIKDRIAIFINQASTHKMLCHEDRPVSLQFIQFGSDPHATEILQSLDNDLPWEKNIPDAVDTEPAYGDINKMILGSFNDIWDQVDGSTDQEATIRPYSSFSLNSQISLAS